MKKIVYSCPFVPAEWIAAHGLRPSRIRPHAAAWPPAVHLTTGICPYARAFVNQACADADAAAVIFTTLCDQMRRASELIGLHCDRPVFLMNVPATWQSPQAHKLYADELKRLGRFLVRLGGRAPTSEKLAEVMLECDRARSVLRDARPGLSAGQYSQAIADLQASGQWRRGAAEAAGPVRGVAVALVGGPLLQDDLGIFELLEGLGGRVVLDATESGELCLPAPLDRRTVRADPLSSLAEAYFGSLPHPFRRPNSELYKWLKRELAARDVRGVVFRYYLWCDKWRIEAQRFKDWTGLPVLDINVNEEESPSRIAGRIEGFLEVLK